MNKEESKALVLESEERPTLVLISAGDPPYSQRAQALLALADGNTQAEAAEQSGLTTNQVRYWLGRFRSQRLTVFPEDLVTAVAEAVVVEEIGAEAKVSKKKKPAKKKGKKAVSKKKKSKAKKKKSQSKKKKNKKVKSKKKDTKGKKKKSKKKKSKKK